MDLEVDIFLSKAIALDTTRILYRYLNVGMCDNTALSPIRCRATPPTGYNCIPLKYDHGVYLRIE